jgi:hypothetical protein
VICQPDGSNLQGIKEIAAMSNLLLPIFRLLPSRGLRYVPIRPIAAAAPRSVAIAPAPKRAPHATTFRSHTNQIPS